MPRPAQPQEWQGGVCACGRAETVRRWALGARRATTTTAARNRTGQQRDCELDSGFECKAPHFIHTKHLWSWLICVCIWRLSLARYRCDEEEIGIRKELLRRARKPGRRPWYEPSIVGSLQSESRPFATRLSMAGPPPRCWLAIVFSNERER